MIYFDTYIQRKPLLTVTFFQTDSSGKIPRLHQQVERSVLGQEGDMGGILVTAVQDLLKLRGVLVVHSLVVTGDSQTRFVVVPECKGLKELVAEEVMRLDHMDVALLVPNLVAVLLVVVDTPLVVVVAMTVGIHSFEALVRRLVVDWVQ